MLYESGEREREREMSDALKHLRGIMKCCIFHVHKTEIEVTSPSLLVQASFPSCLD